MAAGSHDSRASEEANPSQGAVKTEVNTEELKSKVEENAASDDAGSATNASASASGANAPGTAATPVKQETYTGSVFEQQGRRSNPQAETYTGTDLSPEEESD
eukprot:5483194-Karenia_brevis.AAC.1